MKSMNFKQGCILSEQGESRLLRAALVPVSFLQRSCPCPQ
ncbi:hypothetical protein ECO1752_08355 [Escherichia coli]|nr:hypothetical protein ECO1752_08355 [Escherichia coli]